MGNLTINEIGEIDGISQRMLTVTVRALERDGLVTRHIYAEIPPRVEYQLTDLGRSLLIQIIGLGEWASDQILTARTQFDTRERTTMAVDMN